MASHLRVQNDRSCAVTVWVEPWGRDYTLLQDEDYTFTALDAGEDFYFHVTWQEKDLLLYAEGTCDDVVVHCGDVEVGCGHNREHRTDRAF